MNTEKTNLCTKKSFKLILSFNNMLSKMKQKNKYKLYKKQFQTGPINRKSSERCKQSTSVPMYKELSIYLMGNLCVMLGIKQIILVVSTP